MTRRPTPDETYQEQKWSHGVCITLDWTRPLEELREKYDQAAEESVKPAPVVVWMRADMRDPFEE